MTERPTPGTCIAVVLGEYVPSGWQGEDDAIREETVRLIRAGALIRDVAETWREILEVIDDD